MSSHHKKLVRIFFFGLYKSSVMKRYTKNWSRSRIKIRAESFDVVISEEDFAGIRRDRS